jgi:hypothetical protein
MTPKKDNARSSAGAKFTKLAGGVNVQHIDLDCNAEHINGVVQQLQDNGVGLQSTSGLTQIATLPKALEFRGAKGLNTYEGTAAGYARLATRIQDLEENGWVIASYRENVIGPDGLFHAGIARYVLIGKRQETSVAQFELGLGAA